LVRFNKIVSPLREALYTVKEEIFFSEKKRRMLEDRRRVKSALRAKRDARKAAAPVEGERYMYRYLRLYVLHKASFQRWSHQSDV
jgi:hypothetical protein